MTYRLNRFGHEPTSRKQAAADRPPSLHPLNPSGLKSMRSDDTIFAIASGHGRAAVSVVRISGSQCRLILESLAGGVPAPRRLSLRALKSGPACEPLDQALVAWMPGPGSFTG